MWTVYNARMAEILRSKEVPPGTGGDGLGPRLPLCPPYQTSNEQASDSHGYVKNMVSIPRVHSAVLPETPTIKPAQLSSLLPDEPQKYIQRAAIPVQSTSSNKLAHLDDGAEVLVTAGPTDLGRISSTMKPRLVEGLLPPRTSGSDRGVAKPSKWNKRALELDETPELAAGSPVEAKRRRTSKGIKSDEEKGLIVCYMQEEMNEGNVTEKKWANIARKLKDHGLDRSQCRRLTFCGQISAQPTLFEAEAVPGTTIELLNCDAVIHKVHVKGVDDLATADLKAFAAEHHSIDLPVRYEWIDDTSVNIVYSTPAAAMVALKSFSLPTLGQNTTSIPLLQVRSAKTMSDHPDSRLQVRIATSTDVKQPRAHEASRFYMMHPEHDPRERARRQKNANGQHDYRRWRYGDDEYRRRQLRDRGGSYDASMYDDDVGARAGERAHSRRSSSSLRSAETDRGRRFRGGRGDFYRPGSKTDHNATRNRSASPVKRDEDHTAVDARPPRQRTPPRNRDKELFLDASFVDERVPQSKELFPNKTIAANLKKELFPLKSRNPHHRRSDAFDAADETADLFAQGLAFSERKSLARDTVKVGDSSFGRLRSSDPEPQYDLRDNPEDAGISIRGASIDYHTGFSIRGAAQGTIRELFPGKAGNSGDELYAERLRDRIIRRNKAEDLFY
ncbi:MAG: hypothetical protein Q9210_000548 [Variospora velana]